MTQRDSASTTPSDPGSSPIPSGVPIAEVRPKRRVSPVWLLPVLALALAGGLVWQAWAKRGVVVTVRLESGYGLSPGDPVRYRGIKVGEVRSVEIADDLDGIVTTASLYSQGDRIARQGSRFWVVRPEIGFAGVVGLETIVGPRYLTVIPGSGPRQRQFIGLDRPPIVESVDPGDLEVIVRAPRLGGLLAGGPVLYREVPIGTILSAGLTSDAGAVEARLHIESAYAPLIRTETKFWRFGGIRARIGFSGVDVSIDSLPSLLKGGVGVATPPPPLAGEAVRTGHRFALADEPEKDWLAWEPLVPIGSEMLPAGSILPDCRRAKLVWRQGILRTTHTVQGWVLAVPGGILGPDDLLRTSEKAREEGAVLEVAGQGVQLPAEPESVGEGLALAKTEPPSDMAVWPLDHIRRPTRVEDCLAMADPNAASLPLSASRLRPAKGGWAIDAAIPIDEGWYGAPVLARADGKLVGILLLVDGEARVAWMPAGDDG